MTRSRSSPRFSPRPGHAERLVLVVAVGVQGVEGRFRDPPGHAQLPAVLDLPGHRRAARLGDERAGQAAEQQPRHQVLEHRAAPGEQPEPPRAADERPAELEPVPARRIAPRDGQEARQARLGGEQVVTGAVEPPLRRGCSRSRTGADRACRAAGSPSPAARASARSASRCRRFQQLGSRRVRAPAPAIARSRLGDRGSSRSRAASSATIGAAPAPATVAAVQIRSDQRRPHPLPAPRRVVVEPRRPAAVRPARGADRARGPGPPARLCRVRPDARGGGSTRRGRPAVSVRSR